MSPTQQLSMSYRLKRQRGREGSPLRAAIFSLAAAISTGLLYSRWPVSWPERPEVAAKAPRHERTFVSLSSVPDPAADLPVPVLHGSRGRLHVASRPDSRRKAEMRPATGAQAYTFIFEGRATIGAQPCAKAKVRVQLGAGRQSWTATGRTDENGNYSIPLLVQAVPGSAVDWSLHAATPGTEGLQFDGRRIAMFDEPTVVVQRALELPPS